MQKCFQTKAALPIIGVTEPNSWLVSFMIRTRTFSIARENLTLVQVTEIFLANSFVIFLLGTVQECYFQRRNMNTYSPDLNHQKPTKKYSVVKMHEDGMLPRRCGLMQLLFMSESLVRIINVWLHLVCAASTGQRAGQA